MLLLASSVCGLSATRKSILATSILANEHTAAENRRRDPVKPDRHLRDYAAPPSRGKQRAMVSDAAAVRVKWRQFEPEVILLAVGWYLRFPFRTATSRSCSPSGACAPITSPSGGGSSAMARKWNNVCVGDSNLPTTVGGWMKPTSGLRASGCILKLPRFDGHGNSNEKRGSPL
jgi:hypothetical protein